MAIGAIIGGIGSYFGAKEQSKAAKKQMKMQIAQLNAAAAGLQADYEKVISDIMSNPVGYAGSRVQAALYQPVSLAESLRGTIGANQQNLGRITNLIGGANRSTLNSDFARADAFSPNILSTLSTLGGQASQLSRGQLPTDVINNIISSRAGRSGALGAPGGAAPATLKDLGLSSLDAIGQGSSLLQQVLQGAEAVSPMSRQLSAAQYMFDPNTGLQTDLGQAQLQQQSQQNFYNLAATPDPALAMMAQLRLQMANNTASTKAGIAGLQQSPIMPYSQIYGQIGQGLGQGLQNLFGGLFGGD